MKIRFIQQNLHKNIGIDIIITYVYNIVVESSKLKLFRLYLIKTPNKTSNVLVSNHEKYDIVTY